MRPFSSDLPLTITLVVIAVIPWMHAWSNLPVRNWVSDSNSSGVSLVDGAEATSWASTGSGMQASFLLDDPHEMNTSFVLSSGTDSGQPYELLGSNNNRQWTTLINGIANVPDEQWVLESFPSHAFQYVRFRSLTDKATNWEVLVGREASVLEEVNALAPHDWGDVTDPQVILNMIDKAFDWEIRNETLRQDSTGWVNGAFYTGVSSLYYLTDDPKYRQAIIDKGEFANWILRLRTGGKDHYHADDHCLGQSWLDLYLKDSPETTYWIDDVKDRLDRVMADPKPGREDMDWCDALYMSPPNYPRMAAITGNSEYQSFIDNQWFDTTDHLYDRDFHLFYRDSRYFDDREPNGQPVFWSRGNGWVIGGIIRMLEWTPLDWPGRSDYIDLLGEMCASLASIQGEDGLWSSSLLYPEKYGLERETSGSAFFTYAMAWAVNQGILDAQTYGLVIERAWAGLATMLNEDGTIEFIQQVGAGPAANNGVYTDKDYGYGAFILAGVEMIRYFETAESTQKQLFAALSSPLFNGQSSDWSPVDTFESEYSWSISNDTQYNVNLQADPVDHDGSKVFSLNTGFRSSGRYRATKGIPAIADGATATMYQRFAYTNPEIDVLFGISDEAFVDDYNDYENGIRVRFDSNKLEARSGGSYIEIGQDLLQLDTWYEVWTVINNQADTYDVYLRGGSNYPHQILLESDIPFRNGNGSSIVSYSISYNAQYCEGSFYLDDVFIDTNGVNLSRPAGVRQSSYSHWSNIGKNALDGFKQVDIGTVQDDNFPYFYIWELREWVYFPAEQPSSEDYYVYAISSGRWLLFKRGIYAWNFVFDEGSWYWAGVKVTY